MSSFRAIAPLAALLALAACAPDAPLAPTAPDASLAARVPADIHADKAVTVMTRNLYLGADIAHVLGASSPQELVGGASMMWATIQATNFPARAGALAREIAATRPALVGLQEVSLFRVQVPSDQFTPSPTPATSVAYDFLAILLDSLAGRGLDYRAASVVQNFDAELPAFVAPGVLGDVRLTDRDAILARGDVVTTDARGGWYVAGIPIQVGGPAGPQIFIPRGWTSVVADVDGRTFRMMNTHLEVGSFAPVNVAQGRELVAMLAGETLPIVLTGDLNSDALGGSTPTWAEIRAAGYRDTWAELRPDDAGRTCCFSETVNDAVAAFQERIDFVLFRDPKLGARGPMDARAVDIVGEEAGDRLASGLWPSDHAGVVATLRVPNRVAP